MEIWRHPLACAYGGGSAVCWIRRGPVDQNDVQGTYGKSARSRSERKSEGACAGRCDMEITGFNWWGAPALHTAHWRFEAVTAHGAALSPTSQHRSNEILRIRTSGD